MPFEATGTAWGHWSQQVPEGEKCLGSWEPTESPVPWDLSLGWAALVWGRIINALQIRMDDNTVEMDNFKS